MLYITAEMDIAPKMPSSGHTKTRLTFFGVTRVNFEEFSYFVYSEKDSQ